MLKFTLFAKKRKTKEGKEFYNFFTTLTRKDGSELTTSVKFNGCEPPKPSQCPINLEVPRDKANLSLKTVTADDGNVYENNTLWVKEYTEGEPYVDHSLDEF